MAGFTMEKMQEIQKELQEKYREQWGGLDPDKGKQQLLWMIAEAGEVADIMKKKGSRQIMEDPQVRHDFIEEMCDVLMYFNDVLLCYGIEPEDVEKAYLAKHERNMKRW
ncbi:MAG: nucleotide pyrophosphohydrolase [Lachnospiraceae bacterium]|nr:nucleotide pyrophosphohydrolase [Lachnospiraceae bacterium]